MSALPCPCPEFEFAPALSSHPREEHPPTGPRLGRPRLCTPGLIAAIATLIREEGISDSAAGSLAGVSTTTLSRWKQEDEEVAIALGQARALYGLERARAIRDHVTRDGLLDWRAQAWLLQYSNPETLRHTLSPPSRPRRARTPGRACANGSAALRLCLPCVGAICATILHCFRPRGDTKRDHSSRKSGG